MIHTSVNIGGRKREYPYPLDYIEFTIRDSEKYITLSLYRKELEENKTTIAFLKMLRHKINNGIKILEGLENDSKKHETDQE